MKIKNKPTIFLTVEETSILRHANEIMCNLCNKINCSDCPIALKDGVCGLDAVKNLLDVSKPEEES